MNPNTYILHDVVACSTYQSTFVRLLQHITAATAVVGFFLINFYPSTIYVVILLHMPAMFCTLFFPSILSMKKRNGLYSAAHPFPTPSQPKSIHTMIPPVFPLINAITPSGFFCLGKKTPSTPQTCEIMPLYTRIRSLRDGIDERTDGL